LVVTGFQQMCRCYAGWFSTVMRLKEGPPEQRTSPWSSETVLLKRILFIYEDKQLDYSLKRVSDFQYPGVWD
jgi:hypothetical protein